MPDGPSPLQAAIINHTGFLEADSPRPEIGKGLSHKPDQRLLPFSERERRRRMAQPTIGRHLGAISGASICLYPDLRFDRFCGLKPRRLGRITDWGTAVSGREFLP